MLKNFLQQPVCDLVTTTQYGFQKHRSAIDVDNVLERRKLCVFIDFSKAFDRVEPDAILRAIREAGISEDIVLRILDVINGTVLVIHGKEISPAILFYFLVGYVEERPW